MNSFKRKAVYAFYPIYHNTPSNEQLAKLKCPRLGPLDLSEETTKGLGWALVKAIKEDLE